MPTESSVTHKPALLELPPNLPDGRALTAKGRERGSAVALGRSAFCEQHGLRSEAQYKAAMAAAGELTWCMIMGLSSVDEQIDGLHYLDRLSHETGMVIDRGLVIPNWVSGIPPAIRDQAPAGTSFILDGLEDHIRIAQATPIQPCFNDWHIGSPYCVDNTLAAIRAGGSYHGVLAQIMWEMPLAKDDVAHIAENIEAIGVVAAFRDDWLVVDSYMDDGMPSHFLDNISLVGYALLEKYIVDELCGARYATGFGGLISDILTKVSVWLALSEVLKADHPCLSYLFGNTIAPSDHHVVQNFGVVATEYGIAGAVERRYRTGVSLLPIPITEKIEVPTREAIGDVRLVAGRAADRREFDRLIDWSQVEAQRDVLVENGMRFFDNALKLLSANGVDTADPLQMFLALRRLGAVRLEALCHPGPRDESRPNGIVPFVPTELVTMTDEMTQRELAEITARGLDAAVKGERFLVASADTHWYGAHALKSVLVALGAEVVDAGAERDPDQLVEAAEREGWPAIAVSTHNGQCVAYGERLLRLLAESGVKCPIYMGGKLNAIADGETEPSDMCQRLRDMGIRPCLNVVALVEEVAAQRLVR